jgi:hypothetical protein
MQEHGKESKGLISANATSGQKSKQLLAKPSIAV